MAGRREVQDGEAALAEGDFAAYGVAQQQLKSALDRAAAAQRRIIGDSVSDGSAEAPAEATPGAEPPAEEAPAAETPAPQASAPAA